MAAPTVVGVGAAASATVAITPGFPTGPLADGDILIGLGESVGNEAYTLPAGWAHVLGSPVNVDTTTRLTVLWKRYAAGDTAASWGDPGNHAIGRIIAIRGAKTSGDPWNVAPVTSQETVADTSADWPSVDTTVADCLIVLVIATGRDITSTANLGAVTNAALTSIAEQMDNWTASGTGGGVGMATGVKTTAGTVGASTATMASTDAKALMTIAVEPAAAASLSRTAADTASASDTADRTVAEPRAIADTSAATDAATRAGQGFVRTAGDTAAATDVAAGTVNGQSFSRTASDTAAASDTASRITARARGVTDTAAASDTATRTTPKTRAAADTASAADLATRSPLARARATADTAQAADTASKALVRGRAAADVAQAVDMASRGFVIARAVTDVAASTDAASGVIGGQYGRRGHNVAGVADQPTADAALTGTEASGNG